jgi:excisionase family DNA binding protein
LRASLGMRSDDAIDQAGVRRVSLKAPLLAADEIGRLLAVPSSSVYEYARRRCDPLPSIRIGRHVRFYRSDVERWLEAQRFGDEAARPVGAPTRSYLA